MSVEIIATQKRYPASRSNSVAKVRPISQILVGLESTESEDAFSMAQGEVLKWMNRNSDKPLPEHAWGGETFELDGVSVQRTSAVAFRDSSRYWAAFQDNDDRDIPRRTWTTEVGLAVNESGLAYLGCRLVCTSRGEDPPALRSIPNFIRNIVRKGTAYFDEGYHLNDKPEKIRDEDAVLDLIKLLVSRDRRAPVIIFSLDDEETTNPETEAQAQAIHNRTLGAAHVCILTGPASFHLSRQLGKEFSVFRRAIRTYRPDFDPGKDQPSRHPLALPYRIPEWEERWGLPFNDFVVNQALSRTVSSPGYEDRVPSFTTVRRIHADRQRRLAKESHAPDSDLLELAEDEIETLKRQLDEQRSVYSGLLELSEEEREQAVQESQEAKSRGFALRNRIIHLEAKLRERGDTEVEIPDNLDTFQDWCELHLAGSVTVHNRAFRGIKKSNFEDIGFIYRSLLLLRDYYVPMRRADSDGLKKAYTKVCREMGLQESASLSESRYKAEGDTYVVNYSGRNRILERHLKKGISRDARNCFRLYFFWDEESEQAVVGWLPSHLNTRAT